MFAERLKQLRKSNGITQEQLAAIIGVERSSVGKYEGRSQTIPSDDVKYRIAEYFGVTVDYLMGYTDNPKPAHSDSHYTETENALIKDFRALNEEGQQKVIDYIDDLIASGRYIKNHSVLMGKEA
jgi:transcriptional regulator with XRE-family HTH domain